MGKERLYLFDTTLRDGNQTQGVDFSVEDKRLIAEALDALGVDYVEGGWPGANPTDSAFFADPPKLDRAQFTAFGMTRRPGRSAQNDPGLMDVLNAGTPAVCLVGKTWDYHVDVALGIEEAEAIDLIADSIALTAGRAEALFDAEHFFDGYKAKPEFTLKCIEAAYEAGARWVVLCDTNGGTLPAEVENIVAEVARRIPGERLGMHAQNDTENAVANSLAALKAGVRQIQGTLNGLGERCGNANLVSLIPSLMLKRELAERFETGIAADGLKHLTHVSRLLDERLNRAPAANAPYVGDSAFAHKGGLHGSAVLKDPRTYEHVPPEAVGNRRHVLVSDQAGRANLIMRMQEFGLDIDPSDARIGELVAEVKEREFQGYAYDDAETSFELMALRALGKLPQYFVVESFRVLVERRYNARGELITVSEATVKVNIDGERHLSLGEGNGPVNALDYALRKDLGKYSDYIEDLVLVDYKVRILTSGTEAVTRVMIESADAAGRRWSTVGVSPNIVDASFQALNDSIVYKLYRDGAPAGDPGAAE
ncbi:MAG: citramalate synthase [Alphaproteobacteria bacterium]|nr:citramalate synthase [Rhodospirillaceae bacterium]MDP6405541.1 citramalate synthase [Alphaproteobacteria bacterium]MDP6621195.1 citramalate synthase [Alphaproteobacteria bacterium]|tara:strand:+ start:369 stop:1985 length:1617 start_codon:yes stop_codon:yes gene_type:complete